MNEASLRRIEDIGLKRPKGFPEEDAAHFIEYVAIKAATLHSQAMASAGPDVAVGVNPWVRLKFMLEIMTSAMLPQIDRTIAEFAAAPAEIQCRSGCAFCCYQNVDLTIPEAILVALRLTQENDPRRGAILEAADRFKDLDDEARIATGRPCPLLVDRRCSVYEARPMACRSLVSPDSARCREAMRSLEAGEGVQPIEIYVVLQFLCNGEQAATRGLCRDLGLQDDIVEMTQTVAAILRDPHLVERWAGGERVFAAR
ncbi:MAG TPA: YkgJ family cysteine cluster protein [Stellaceae bacterium]|nr:YkgJ family cysteine cluster protein [Stellaceae bacterium]